MTKKQAKEKAKKMRVFIPMNTGTRIEPHGKQYDRKKSKKDLARRIREDE